jgi:hypothetical protein
MSIESINGQFEVFMRDMMKAQECAQENIESEFRRVIRATVNSCATMYGFSAEEALKRLNSSGEINEVQVLPIQQKEAEKAEKLRLKEAEKAEKAEKLRLKEAEKAFKEAEKAKKLKDKAFEKIEALRRKEYENAKKANESSERTLMKEEDISSKVAEKAEKLRLKEAEKALKKTEKPSKKTKKIKEVVDDSDASTVIMSASEDEEPHVLFQNIPLINEINSIRDVKKFKNWKKLSAGVKLARQILDI